MSRKSEALKKTLIAIGHGSASDYNGNSVDDVLKELAVVLECAPSVDDIRATTTTGILNFITDNYGSEEKEPYDLTITGDEHVTLTVKVNGKTATAGADKLYNGDKIKVTATAAEGYTLSTLTLNGEDIESGDVNIVNGHSVTIVAAATLNTYDLARSGDNCTIAVTKGAEAVEDGEGVISHGDELTITATAEEGYTLTSLKVNGEDFVSGSAVTVDGNVTIEATTESEG